MRGDGWSVRAYLETGRLANRLYAPYGPELESAEALKPALEALRSEALRLGAIVVRVEPTINNNNQPSVPKALLEAASLKEVVQRQPKFTRRVPLNRPFEETLLQMRKRYRSLHRNFSSKGLSVRFSQNPEDVEHLIRLMKHVSERTGMVAHAPDYLRAQAQALLPTGHAKIYLVELEGVTQPIAAAMIFDDATRRYYAHAAADTEHRKLQANSILMTCMMQDATEMGLQEFDLYGIVPSEIRDHPWTGFSDFKATFGGTQITYSGTWELPVRRFRYAIYRLMTRLYAMRYPTQPIIDSN